MRRIALAAGTATLLVALPATAGAWSTPRFVGDGVTEGLGIDRSGRVTLLWSASPIGNPQPALFASQGRVGGPMTRQRLAVGNAAPRLATADSGYAAVAWVDTGSGCANPIDCRGALRVATKRPGGRFGRPTTVLRNMQTAFALAVGERGDVLVAWSTRARPSRSGRGVPSEVVVAAHRVGDRVWRRQSVGEAGFPGGTPLGLAAGRDGSAVVAWSWASAVPTVPGRTYVATRRGRGRFTPSRFLYRPGGVDFRALVEPRGGVLLTWQTGVGFGPQIVSARRTAAGRWLRPQILGSGVSPSFAADAGGRAIVVWSIPQGSHPADAATRTATRAPGRAFSASAGLPPLGQYPQVALMAGDRAVVAWQRTTRVDAPPELLVAELRGRRLVGPGRVVAPTTSRPRLAANRVGDRALAFMAHDGGEPWFRTMRVMISTEAG